MSHIVSVHSERTSYVPTYLPTYIHIYETEPWVTSTTSIFCCCSTV